MKERIQKKLSDSKAARWSAMMIVSFTMMCGYFLTDVMSPLENLLTTKGKVVYFTDDTSMSADSLVAKVKVFAAANSMSEPDLTVDKLEAGMKLQYLDRADAPDGVEKTVGAVAEGEGWSSTEYGFFSGAYGMINVFLLMLFFGGLILDKMGIRFTGLMSCGLMLAGALVKWYALAADFGASQLFGMNMQVALAALGFAVFGMGVEIAGITTSKVIVKWFTGKELALAMGLQVAMARIGTAIALGVSLPVARMMGEVSYPVLFGAIALCVGLLSFMVYCVLDRKEDASEAAALQEEGKKEEEGFKLSDLKLIFGSRGFWLITLLCLMFYAGVFPFLKFATKLMIYQYDVPESFAGLIPALLPFGTILLTPLFGSLYDRIGKGATLMLIGSVMLTVVHVLFTLTFIDYWWFAVVVMVVLGIAFSLVPSAMWPSVPKIIPLKQLGSAYAIIFYIQNIGLMAVPWLIGWVIDRFATVRDMAGNIVGYDYAPPMAIFSFFGLCAIVIAVLLRREDAKKHYGLEDANIKK